MDLPKFLIADNSDYPENIFILHTDAPIFILDIDSDEVKILDGSTPDGKTIASLKALAYEFYEHELDSYEEDEEEGYGSYN